MAEATDHQYLSTSQTTWHITWGTKGARLHGGDRPTVDRYHNQPDDPFVTSDTFRAWAENDSLRGGIVYLTREQQLFAQETIPQLCERGGWALRTCSAAHDHVHVLLDVDPSVHGERVRRLLKRWLSEAMNERFGRRDGDDWWAVQGIEPTCA